MELELLFLKSLVSHSPNNKNVYLEMIQKFWFMIRLYAFWIANSKLGFLSMLSEALPHLRLNGNRNSPVFFKVAAYM